MNKAIKHLLIIISLLFLPTCGSGPHHDSDTGAINFSLKWGGSTSSSSSPYASLSPSGNVCLDYGIDTISAEVYNSSNADVASASWDCPDHGGTISNVPVGSGMRVVIEGTISGSSVMWRGERTGISVTVNQTTQVDPIRMKHTTDTESPNVDSTVPDADATAVAIDTSISVTFNEQVVWSSGDNTPTFFTVNNGSVDISGTVTYYSDIYTVTFIPDSYLSDSTEYTATITKDVQDLAGNQLTDDYTWSFTTLDTTAPTVISTSPANRAVNVLINSSIRATFSEAMLPSTITTNNFTLIGPNGSPVYGTVQYSDTVAFFLPLTNLDYASSYTAIISTGVEDSAGNPMEVGFSWTFTTGGILW